MLTLKNATFTVVATDALPAGLVNAMVDYVIDRPVEDEKGVIFPSNHFHSPWAYANIPEKLRTRKWCGKFGEIQEGYDGDVVWNPKLRLGMSKWKAGGRRQELFVNFAKRTYQAAAERRQNIQRSPQQLARPRISTQNQEFNHYEQESESSRFYGVTCRRRRRDDVGTCRGARRDGEEA